MALRADVKLAEVGGCGLEMDIWHQVLKVLLEFLFSQKPIKLSRISGQGKKGFNKRH